MKNQLTKEKLLKKPNNLKELALGMFMYNASSILGPLIVFLIIGYIFDKIFNTRPMFMIIGVIIAFIITNILTFRKIQRLMIEFHTTYPKPEKNTEDMEDVINNENKS